jgi:hypothetical protein
LPIRFQVGWKLAARQRAGKSFCSLLEADFSSLETANFISLLLIVNQSGETWSEIELTARIRLGSFTLAEILNDCSCGDYFG